VTASSQSSTSVGADGQISLGKQFADRQALAEEQEPGVWLVRTATVIPDNERWLHEPKAAADLARALDWSRSNATSDVANAAMITKLTDAL
jgi:hypothetical protein